MVDPDEIRRHLPEFYDYDSQQAGEMTRLEAGMIAELLTLVALSNGQNVLVDGSLKDSVWYQQYFAQLRTDYPWLQIAILHITAPKQAVLDRAQVRTSKSYLLKLIFFFLNIPLFIFICIHLFLVYPF